MSGTRLHILVLGSETVGINQLVSCFMENVTNVGEKARFGQSAFSNYSLDNKTVDGIFNEISIIPGVDARIPYHLEIDAIMFVFSLADRKSLENIRYYIASCRNNFDQPIPMVLIANKTDCINQDVSKIEAWAKTEDLPLSYTDVTDKLSIKMIFDEIIKTAVSHKENIPLEKQDSYAKKIHAFFKSKSKSVGAGLTGKKEDNERAKKLTESMSSRSSPSSLPGMAPKK